MRHDVLLICSGLLFCLHTVETAPASSSGLIERADREPSPRLNPDDGTFLAIMHDNPITTGVDHIYAIGATQDGLTNIKVTCYPDRKPMLHTIRDFWKKERDRDDMIAIAEHNLQDMGNLLSNLVVDSTERKSFLLLQDGGYWRPVYYSSMVQHRLGSFSYLMNPIDGMIIRLVNQVPPVTTPWTDGEGHLRPPAPFEREAAMITAEWYNLCSTRHSNYDIHHFGTRYLLNRRHGLRWLLDPLVRDAKTLQILQDILAHMFGAHGVFEDDGQYAGKGFFAGSAQFAMLLGSPSGQWAAELLYMYSNKDGRIGLGHKIIKAVRVFTLDPAKKTFGLAWELVDAEEATSRGYMAQIETNMQYIPGDTPSPPGGQAQAQSDTRQLYDQIVRDHSTMHELPGSGTARAANRVSAPATGSPGQASSQNEQSQSGFHDMGGPSGYGDYGNYPGGASGFGGQH